MFNRYFTVGSVLIIRSKRFKEGLDRIKHNDLSFNKGGRKEIQTASGFGQALYKLGWSAVYTKPPSPDIRGLEYRASDKLPRDSRFIPYVIAKIVEPGGYIKFADNKTNLSKIYKFDNKQVKQETLYKKYIDIKSEQNLLELLEFSVDGLYNINKVPKDLITYFKQKYIKRIMDC